MYGRVFECEFELNKVEIRRESWLVLGKKDRTRERDRESECVYVSERERKRERERKNQVCECHFLPKAFS